PIRINRFSCGGCSPSYSTFSRGERKAKVLSCPMDEGRKRVLLIAGGNSGSSKTLSIGEYQAISSPAFDYRGCRDLCGEDHAKVLETFRNASERHWSGCSSSGRLS